jgi:hypothetical protein
MMRALRAAVFGLAEGMRLYLESARSAPADSGRLSQQARSVAAEGVGVVERGRG